MIRNKTLGAALILAGTMIGAGMLALPLTSATIGLGYSIVLLAAMWALMMYTALLTLEVNLHFPLGANFSSMAKTLLGSSAQKITLFALSGLFYSLLAAYFTGSAAFFEAHLAAVGEIDLPPYVNILLMVLFFGGLISWHTAAVDIVNKFLFALKVVAFGFVVALMAPKVGQIEMSEVTLSPHALGLALPVFFTSFGFHGSIPTLVEYLHKDAVTLRRVFILGSLIPLVVYICWQVVTLGVVPSDRLTGDVAALGQEVHMAVGGSILIKEALNIFAEVALLTSLLGVGVGFFDFWKDALSAYPALQNRFMVAVVTFAPPAFFALFYPAGFIAALGFAAIFLTILAIFLPACLALKQRQMGNVKGYRAPFGTFGIGVALAAGGLICLVEVLHWL